MRARGNGRTKTIMILRDLLHLSIKYFSSWTSIVSSTAEESRRTLLVSVGWKKVLKYWKLFPLSIQPKWCRISNIPL